MNLDCALCFASVDVTMMQSENCRKRSGPLVTATRSAHGRSSGIIYSVISANIVLASSIF